MDKKNTIFKSEQKTECPFDKKPLIINYEKWLKKENKVLYITGISGSGKGYYAKKIANKIKNCVIFELDKFENYTLYMDKGPDKCTAVNKGTEIIYDYLKFHYDLSNDIFDKNIVKYNQLMTLFYNYLLTYINTHPENYYIIEGLQIFCDDAFMNLNSSDSIIIIQSVILNMEKVMSRPFNNKRNLMHTNTDFQQRLSIFVKNISFKENIPAEESIFNKSTSRTFNTPEELSQWMIENIQYTNFTLLQSPIDVYINRKGSCHDQVAFEMFYLRAMKIDPKAIFLIESNMYNQGGITHSFVYYRKNGKVYWFENAWEAKAGIHEFNSLDDIFKYFNETHKQGLWGNFRKYPRVDYRPFVYKIGDSLQILINKAFKPH